MNLMFNKNKVIKVHGFDYYKKYELVSDSTTRLFIIVGSNKENNTQSMVYYNHLNIIGQMFVDWKLFKNFIEKQLWLLRLKLIKLKLI